MLKSIRNTNTPLIKILIELIFLIRALLYFGSKYSCPVCGWSFREFTKGGGSFRGRHFGYCPRCNSKSRHRHLWLYLSEHTNIFNHRLKVLHVSPHYSLSRRMIKMSHLDYTSIDIVSRENITHLMDLTELSFESDSFDVEICIHVLEHIEKDIKAIRELYRVLKPGGYAIISVPISLDKKTHEDLLISTPEARKKYFGEEDHYRYYGYDFSDRLVECGFKVKLDMGKDIKKDLQQKHGLFDDENIYYCFKK